MNKFIPTFTCLLAASVAFAILLPYCLQNKDCTILDTYNVVSVVPTATDTTNCTMTGYLSSSQSIKFNLTDPVACLITKPGQSFPVCYSAFGESTIQVPPLITTSVIAVVGGSMLSVCTGLFLILTAVVIQLDARSKRYNPNVIA